MGLEKKDIEIIQEIFERTIKGSEERLREGIESSTETLRGELAPMEERLLIETAAAEGRMRQQIEELAGMTMREFNRMAKRISELSDRLQLVERRIAQLETRFGMMEDDLRLYREQASHIGSELETFRRHYDAERQDDSQSNKKLEKTFQEIRQRVEKLEAAVFSR